MRWSFVPTPSSASPRKEPEHVRLRISPACSTPCLPFRAWCLRGFTVDFLGTLTDVRFRERLPREPGSDAPRHVTTRAPTIADGEIWFEAVDWSVAARQARERFVMMTLGAWYGAQAVGSYRALQSLNPLPAKLVIVEAEPGKGTTSCSTCGTTASTRPRNGWCPPPSVTATRPCCSRSARAASAATTAWPPTSSCPPAVCRADPGARTGGGRDPRPVAAADHRHPQEPDPGERFDAEIKLVSAGHPGRPARAVRPRRLTGGRYPAIRAPGPSPSCSCSGTRFAASTSAPMARRCMRSCCTYSQPTIGRSSLDFAPDSIMKRSSEASAPATASSRCATAAFERRAL